MAAKNFLTEKDIETLEERFKEIFPTREEFQKYRSELFDRLDVILSLFMANRISENEDGITAIEGRS